MPEARHIAASRNVQMHWGVKIPLRDGAHLHATLYLPKGHRSPSPVLFVMTPYVAQRNHEHAVYFASNGYPFLTVDVRGRGNSEGDFQPFAHEGRDGFDVVEWLARQPYCNGKVGMWGGSYCAYVQWATAAECPPHLATIVPTAAPFPGIDFPMRGNVFPAYLVRWLTLVSGHTSQINLFSDESYWRSRFRDWFESGACFAELDELVGNKSPVFREWLAHPHGDSYWDRFNPTAAQYAGVSIPVLTITGSYDDDQPGALAHYFNHLNAHPPTLSHYLVIGPWDHSGTLTPKEEFLGITVGPASCIDIQKLHLDWYAWALQEGPRPGFLEHKVAHYVMGAEEWRHASALEAVTVREMVLYLRSGGTADWARPGRLASQASATDVSDHYVYDPNDVSLAGLESTVDPESRSDQTMVRAGARLVYESSPFAGAAQISGFFSLSLWIGIDQPDTDFRVSIWDAACDDTAILLSADWLRARYRENARAERLIRTTEPLRYDFRGFTFISRRIERGHRLRLAVGPVHSIHCERNWNSGGIVSREASKDARPVRVSVFHGAAYPSALSVPLASATDAFESLGHR
jgi:putative CocE/NonD family hydrolase